MFIHTGDTFSGDEGALFVLAGSGWLVGWLAGWLAGWMAGWLPAGWLAGWLAG